MSHRQLKPNQETIENIWNANTTHIQCLCPKAPSNLDDHKKLQKCYRCDMEFHSECFWPPEKGQLFQCPFCYLKHCFPHKQVKQILFGGYLPILKKDKIEYKINFFLDPKIKVQKSLYLEARCVKFNNKNRYQISWPDNSSFSIGKMRINQFKPLQTNSPLKRRQDEPIKLDKSRLQTENEIIVQQKNTSQNGYKLNKKCYHLVAIMVISQLSTQSILQKFQNKMLSVKQSKEVLKQYMNHEINQITIQKISISLRCQLYGNKMKLPARSKICSTHFQPFDLMNFINASIYAKVAVKKWKCPICDKRAYDLVVDKYILELMELDNTANEIIFKENGEPEMIKGSQDDKSDQQSKQIYQQVQKKQIEQIIIDLDEEEEKVKDNNAKTKNKNPILQISLQQLSQEEGIGKAEHSQQKQKQASEFKRAVIIGGNAESHSLVNNSKKARKLNDGSIQLIEKNKKGDKQVSANFISIDISDDEDKAIKRPQRQKQKDKPLIYTQKKLSITENIKKKTNQVYPKYNSQSDSKTNISAKALNLIEPKNIYQNKISSYKSKATSSLNNETESHSKPIDIIQIDSDEAQCKTSQEIEKELTAKMLRHKKSMEKEGKAEIMQEDTQIFQGLFAKVMEIAQLEF